MAARLGIGHGIVKQVREELAQPRGIADHGHRLEAVGGHGDVALGGDDTDAPGQAHQQLAFGMIAELVQTGGLHVVGGLKVRCGALE